MAVLRITETLIYRKNDHIVSFLPVIEVRALINRTEA